MSRATEPVPAGLRRDSTSPWFKWARPRLFVDRRDRQRARRASDVLILLVTTVGLAFLVVLASPPSRFESGIVTSLAAIPDVLDGLWRLTMWLGLIWAGFLLVATLVRRRWGVLRDIVVALAATVVLVALVGRLAEGDWAFVWNLPEEPLLRRVPWHQVVGPIAVIATTSPFLTRAFRLFGIWVGFGVVFGALVLSAAPVLVLASAAVAVVAMSATHLIFGSTRGLPELEDVVEGLAALGVKTTALVDVERQPTGVFQLRAVGEDGESLVVKVYGRDAADTQFLSTVWKRLSYRGVAGELTTGRLHQVEHEAYLTLMAEQAGLAAQAVLIGGPAPNDDAILVLRDLPVEAAPAGWDEAAARSLWEALGRLHQIGIVHNHIDADTVVRSEDDVVFRDFRMAMAGPDPWRITVDRIQALVLTAIELGPERAADIAVDALGTDAVAALLPMLQPVVVPDGSKEALRDRDIGIDDLRDEIAGHIGVEPPELARLRRVTVGSVLKGVLPLVAFFALASVFSGIDLGELARSAAEASWLLIVVGLIVAQSPRVGMALSAMGASPVPLPFGRLYVLQLAQGFIGVTVPSAAGGLAMNVRFLQRHGLPGGTAMAAGALDGFASFLVQAALIVAVVVFSSQTLDLDLGGGVSSGLVTGAIILVVVVVIAIGVVFSVPGWRGPLIEKVKGYLADARAAVKGLASPNRLGLLLGGTLLTEVLLVAALGIFVRAFGFSVAFPELILIYTVANLLGNVLPVPGGIGVVEGGLVLGLVGAGLPEEAAFTAAILFRAATFYLPPIWGYPAFRWLVEKKYI